MRWDSTYHPGGAVTRGLMHRGPFRALTLRLIHAIAGIPAPPPEESWDAGLWWPHVARIYPILAVLFAWALLMGFVLGIGFMLLAELL